MNILPINNVSFNGIAITKSEKLISSVNVGGGQGTHEEYERIVEYRPYKNETIYEIRAKIKELSKNEYSSGCPGGPSSAWDSVTKVKVILGKTLDCTKEAAEKILKYMK